MTEILLCIHTCNTLILCLCVHVCYCLFSQNEKSERYIIVIWFIQKEKIHLLSLAIWKMKNLARENCVCCVTIFIFTKCALNIRHVIQFSCTIIEQLMSRRAAAFPSHLLLRSVLSFLLLFLMDFVLISKISFIKCVWVMKILIKCLVGYFFTFIIISFDLNVDLV